MPVDREPGVWQVRPQHAIDRDARGIEGLDRPLAEPGRESRGEHERILLAERDMQARGQFRDDLSTRPRATRLETGHMARRAVRRERELELRHAPSLAP